MTISERIFYLLEKRGKRSSDLARALGVRQTTVSEWKTGKREPSATHYEKLADYFGVSLDYLISGKTTRDAPVQQIIGDNNSYNVATVSSDVAGNLSEWDRELSNVCATFDIRRKTALLSFAYDLEKEMKNQK